MTATWAIESMTCAPQLDGQTNVVLTAQWRCTVEDSNITVTTAGNTSFTYEGGAFTPYADLTQDQVLGWVYANGVDQTEVEASLEAQIQAQLNPPIVIPPLPWAA